MDAQSHEVIAHVRVSMPTLRCSPMIARLHIDGAIMFEATAKIDLPRNNTIEIRRGSVAQSVVG